jgi:hypothetical protein
MGCDRGGSMMCLTDYSRASRARAAMRCGVHAVRPEHRIRWRLCVARVRGPSRADGLRAAACSAESECSGVPATGVLGEALTAKRAQTTRGIVLARLGEALKILGPACCACEWSWSLRAVTAVRGAAELARQPTCLGGTECQHEGGESKSSASSTNTNNP